MDERTGAMRDEPYRRDVDPVADALLNDESPEAIRIEIEETRADMGETIDELANRLDPERLKGEAKSAVRDATIGKAEDAMNTAQQRTKEAGYSIMDTFKRNPVPSALIGIGVGWLVMSSRSQKPAYRDVDQRYWYAGSMGQPTSDSGSHMRDRAEDMAGQVTERAGQMADQAQQQVGQYADQAQQMAGQARGNLESFVNDNPLAAAAIALGVGFAVGYAVPETQKEDELLGEAHAAAMDRARSMADTAIDKAAQSDTVHQKVDEMADKMVDKAKDTAHQATNP
jgi:ElaB/YqjD/DUF883 family membrane-anchored ribosome-binding protein